MRRSLLTTGIALAMTTASASPDFSLTVYSSAAPGAITSEQLANYGLQLPGYALVRDRRELELPNGTGEVRFSDVATRIDPTTVSFASITDPEGTRVIEQNYQFDLVDGSKLLNRYIGQTISVDQVRGDQTKTVTGQLLSATNGLILMQPDGEVQTLSNWANIAFPSLPGGLITKPTLVWLVDAKRGGTHDTQVSYQTQGMTWWSDYNVILKGTTDACEMDLAAWVTVVNQSGASYPNAQLKLVAGEVNRAPSAPAPMALGMAKSRMSAEMAPQGFQESELFEYHLYTLGRRTELPQNSTKQLELFPSATGMKCKRELVFTASPLPYGFWGSPISDQGYGATNSGTVGAWLEFENKEANGLGLPLPAGRVRVNQASRDGSLEFIGEDVIKHTPRNETLRIKLGEAFDVVGDRKQLDYKIDIDAKTIDETFEISVRNRKKEATTIRVREYLYRWSTWAITTENVKHEKRDANTVDFVVNIPADGEQKIKYSVRYTW